MKIEGEKSRAGKEEQKRPRPELGWKSVMAGNYGKTQLTVSWRALDYNPNMFVDTLYYCCLCFVRGSWI